MINNFKYSLGPICIHAMFTSQNTKENYSEANYDESKCQEYNLPDVLSSFLRESIKTVKIREKISRRPEIGWIFAQNMFVSYPHLLGQLKKMFKLNSEDQTFFLMLIAPGKEG